MVLRRTQNQRCDQARCNLLSSQSLPHDLARLYGRTGLFTSADIVSIEGPCSMRYRSEPILMARKSFTATRSRRCEASRLHNQLPDAKGTFYVPGHCPDRPGAVPWIVAVWASCGGNDEPLDEEKPDQSSDEQNHQEAALKQDVDRHTASSQLPQKCSCIMCKKTCCHTYVFRSPDGGPYGL